MDFAGIAAVIAIRENGTLEIDDLVLRGFASRHTADKTGLLSDDIFGLPPWPSIVAEPGAKVRQTEPCLVHFSVADVSCLRFCS
jgi:hypothetical protein